MPRRRTALVAGVLEPSDYAGSGHLGAQTAIADLRDTRYWACKARRDIRLVRRWDAFPAPASKRLMKTGARRALTGVAEPCPRFGFPTNDAWSRPEASESRDKSGAVGLDDQ